MYRVEAWSSVGESLGGKRLKKFCIAVIKKLDWQ